MMGLLIAFFARRLPEPIARLAAWGTVITVLLLVLGLVVLRIRADAVRDERAAVAAVLQAAELAQRELERAAEDRRREELARAARAAEDRRKEIDDATRDLPPAGTSPRQRARACLELRRQAAAAGEPAPAC